MYAKRGKAKHACASSRAGSQALGIWALLHPSQVWIMDTQDIVGKQKTLPCTASQQTVVQLTSA